MRNLALRTLLVGIAALSAAHSASAEGSTLFVDDSAPPGGDGSSWNTAYRFLSDALAAAAMPSSGVTQINVAQGSYAPDQSIAAPGGTGSPSATFHLLGGVTIRGGFAGVLMPNPNARDLNAFITTLGSTTALQIVTANATPSGAVLDGVRIHKPVYQPLSHGVFISNAAPTLVDCRFDSCLAAMGAGLWCDSGSPTFTRCTFADNYAWGGRGGAMYFRAPSNPTMIDCVFTGNHAYGAGGVGDGGAVFLEQGALARFDHCLFQGNYSASSGSVAPTGGAITALGDNLVLNGCRFVQNTCTLGTGGAIWTASDQSDISSCEFVNNSAIAGGAVMSFFAAGLRITNCTLVGNSASDGGALSMVYSSFAEITNCIFWSNAGNGASPYKSAIHTDDTSDATVSWSCIQQMWVAEPGEDPPDPENFPGCTDANPRFVSTTDLRLASDSPLIDAANNTAVPALTTVDVAGLPRFMDSPTTTDTGIGPAPIVDMGAHEFGLPPIIGDINGDGAVNAADLALLLSAWGSSLPAADLNGDGVVGGLDLGVLISAWGTH